MAAIDCSDRYASAEMSLIVHYLFLQVVLLHPSWSKEDSAILTASCNTPTPDIQSFCQQNQPQNQADCQIFLIRAIQRRCTTWLDSDHVKIPVSFEADPVTSCALPMTVDNKPVCVLTKERAVRMNRSNIQQFGRFTCQRSKLDASQCDILIRAIHNTSQREQQERRLQDRESSSVNSNTFIHPKGDISWYYQPLVGSIDGSQHNKNNMLSLTWKRNDHNTLFPTALSTQPHTMLPYGTLRITTTAASNIDAICLLIQRHGDITSNSKLLHLGCFHVQTMKKEDQTTNVLVGNIPYGPHRLIIDGFRFRDQTRLAREVAHVSVVAQIKKGMVSHPSFATCKAYHESKTTLPTLPASLSLLTLVHRGKLALQNALQSWQKSGLLNTVAARIAYVQNYSPNTIKIDTRVLLLESYNFTIVGLPTQQGIGLGISHGIEYCNTSHVLFVEEDFVVDTTGTNIVRVVQQALGNVQSQTLDVVRLRSTFRPGTPNCANVWKGHPANEMTSDINLLSTLDSAVANSNDTTWNSTAVWACGEGERNLCAFSSHASWTNNPFLVERRWFLKHIAAVAAVDATKTLEAAVSFSPGVWSKQCFVVGQSMIKGGFTHMDLDKNQYEQTVCPDLLHVQ